MIAPNVGEDFSMLDENGRVAPDLERPPVSGFRAHAERVIRRWLASLGLIWYARDYGGGLLELLNGPVDAATLSAKNQELRQQAMSEPGTTGARVSLRKVGETIALDATIGVKGYSGSVRVNMNSADITVAIQ